MQNTSRQVLSSDKDYNELFDHALSLCYGLHLNEAESTLDAIIAKHPSACDAYSALALIKLMQGKPAQQKSMLKYSLSINPKHYASLHQLAIVHYRGADFSKALRYARLALAQKPDSESTLLLASKLCLALNNSKEAYHLADKALRQSNRWNPEAASLMALALIHGNDPELLCRQMLESITAGQGSEISLYAVHQLIIALQSENHCLGLFQQQLNIDPDNLFLRLLRVKLLASKGQHDDCFPDLYYLLSLKQDNLIILNSFAEALMAMKRYRESLEVYLRIARINGTDSHLLNQIGVCFRGMGKFRSSEKAYWRSIRQNPLDACIIGNLGEATFRFGDSQRALELYGIALNINPTYREVFYNKMLCYSVGSPDGMRAMREEATAFWSNYRITHGIDVPKSRPEVEEKVTIQVKDHSHPPGTKFRLGILSSDIGNHCVSYFLSSFLRHYNKDQFHIELILCDRRYEEREREICSYVDHALSLEGLSESAARQEIRSRDFDLIMECNGYTGGSGISLLAERCAPIQCHYIGYHASTGLDTIDYFISDNHILSASVTGQLSEKSLKLDRAWLAFSKFEEFPRAKSTAKVNRPLLGFFGNSTKITDTTLEYWASLFKSCPDAILVLKCLSYGDRYSVEKVIHRLESHGIGRASIAILEPTKSWTDHLKCYNLVDYALDSSPWSSATTGFDALGMGVPLLAIQGETIAARMSSSLTSHLGRQEWIAKTPADYASLGRRIAKEFEQVRQEKGNLQREVQDSSLFDGRELAVSLEKALLSILRPSRKAR